jgi:fructokinase
MTIYAAVEGGGTSWKVALVDAASWNVIEQTCFVTSTPEETLGNVRAWLSARNQRYHALGIASFGPVDARPDSPRYGSILSTPKDGWSNTDVLSLIGAKDQPNIPFLFDTDVNAPAMAEFLRLRERDPNISSCAYITVGTVSTYSIATKLLFS